jgi:hypothetical protein
LCSRNWLRTIAKISRNSHQAKSHVIKALCTDENDNGPLSLTLELPGLRWNHACHRTAAAPARGRLEINRDSAEPRVYRLLARYQYRLAHLPISAPLSVRLTLLRGKSNPCARFSLNGLQAHRGNGGGAELKILQLLEEVVRCGGRDSEVAGFDGARGAIP